MVNKERTGSCACVYYTCRITTFRCNISKCGIGNIDCNRIGCVLDEDTTFVDIMEIAVWIIIILSGALFGVMHMQPGDPIVSITTMLLTGSLGTFLSWMSLYKFKTVVPGMATHAVYNSITILLAVLAGIGM